jgi:hypothetical protein
MQRDPIEYINMRKTLDPQLLDIPEALLAAAAPPYTGMQHPPPRTADNGAACNKPWKAPFLSNYTAAEQYGRTLKLTMCNWCGCWAGVVRDIVRAGLLLSLT